MLKFVGIKKNFGTNKAVDDVTLEIGEGQMVGIIGRSGAGKSTLLRMINGLVEPSAGEISFLERKVSDLKGGEKRAWQRDCAMVFQQFNLVSRLDVVSNVLHGTLNSRSTIATLFNIYPNNDIHRAIDILERLGISEHAQKRAEQLSGGQQQRVAIARALMQSPKIILADEPIASLDPMNAQIVMDSLKQINRQDGKTVICNLHTLDTARTYCERVIGMLAGKIVFDGSPEDLTLEVAREIYGADETFREEATSTQIETLEKFAKPIVEMARVTA